jgi:hypothetical protein
LEFRDELGVGLAVGGAEADVGALFDAFRLDEMGTGAAEKHLDDEQGFPIEGREFDVRHQARRDGIGDEVGDALLLIEGIFHADDLAVIRDAENQFSPAELAKATRVLSHGRGDNKSRLNSSVLFSGFWMREAIKEVEMVAVFTGVNPISVDSGE